MIQIAIFIFGLCVLGCFRDRSVRTSAALWIPVVWLFIAGSRPVSVWLDKAPTEAERATSYYSGSPLDGAVWELLVAAGLIVLIIRRPRVMAVLRNNWPTMLFLGYCLLSVCWSDFPFVSLKRWIKALGDFVMVMIVLTDQERVTAIKRVLVRTGFLLLPLSLLFIEFYPELGKTPGSLLASPTIIGVTTNKNELGFICSVWGLGFLWCLLDTIKSRRDEPKGWKSAALAYSAIVGLALWLVITCDSATSLSCLLMGSVLMVLTSVPGIAKRPVLAHLLAISVLSLALTAIFIAPSLLSAVGRNSTLTGRTDVWKLVLGMGSNPLFGTGFEGFWLGSRLEQMWRIYWWHPNEAHEGYIEVLINLGWVGIALLTVLVLKAYGRAVAALPQPGAAGSLRLAYIVIALIYNLSESAFRELHPVWIALLLATTAIPHHFHLDAPSDEPSSEQAEDDPAELWFHPKALHES